MPIQASHLGMRLNLDDADAENKTYFQHCADHDFHLQRCDACALIRYPPTTACPWCGNAGAQWAPVEGKGTVHSYVEVHHAIQPAFRPHLPYSVLVVDLDTQLGQPTEHEALRVLANLTDDQGVLAPKEMVERVGIGARVRMVFCDLGPGLSLPQWTIDEDAPQPVAPWRFDLSERR